MKGAPRGLCGDRGPEDPQWNLGVACLGPRALPVPLPIFRVRPESAVSKSHISSVAKTSALYGSIDPTRMSPIHLCALPVLLLWSCLSLVSGEPASLPGEAMMEETSKTFLIQFHMSLRKDICLQLQPQATEWWTGRDDFLG